MKLRCERVSKAFHTRRGIIGALREVTLEVAEHEFVCLLGPSGCGKTTLLRIVAGLTPLSSGRVVFDGARDGSERTAMVFQEHGLFPWMKIVDNVAFGLETQGVPRKERRARARELLATLGLGTFAGNYPQELSVGMRQRAGLARAFVAGSEILLMDEPFAALDAQTKLIAQEELLRIWRRDRKAILYVTHDIHEALRLADRIVIMTRAPSRVRTVIPVPLPRPRTMETEENPTFLRLKRRIWEELRQELLAAQERFSL